ncbi:MAG TPA: hypothetical protein VN618_10885 [Solirubrobacteraceae bacterium]|nr:hypothetical protein [Solirubrobacteraceae bacterium]
MNEAVVAGCIAVATLNLIPGLVGLLAVWLADARGGLARSFWPLLRVGQGSALTLAIAVGSLAAAGNYSSEELFYLYALLPLAIAFMGEQLRVASAQTVLDQRGLEGSAAVASLPEAEQQELVATIVRREIAVMAVSALVVVFLALRAATTAHGF